MIVTAQKVTQKPKVSGARRGTAAVLGFFVAVGVVLSGTAAAVPFNTRCTGAGVVLCSGFESAADVDNYVSGNDLGQILGTRSTTAAASGTSAMRFTIPSLTGANSSGAYERVFDEAGTGFMEGDTFYAQFRQRFSPEMLSNAMGGNGWKQVILTSQFGYYGDPIEIGLYNRGYENRPTLFQNGIVYDQAPVDGTPVTYAANEWMTFAFRVTLTQWGAETSTIQVWAARENQPLEMIYNVTAAIPENPNDIGSGFNKITLGPDNTGKLDTASHVPATTWYDELIVSSSPIADVVDLDTTAPTVPTLSGTVISSSQVNLSWTQSTDSVGVAGYRLYRGATQVADQVARTFNNTGLTPNTDYIFAVRAYDAAGNLSPASNAITLRTGAAADTTAPTVPAGVATTALSTTEIRVNWTASTDNVGVTGYRVYRNGALLGTPAASPFTDNNLQPSTTYSYRVAAIDAAGNASAQSAQVSGTTNQAPDTQAPTVPSGVSATTLSQTSIRVNWTASTDNVSVSGYRVFRNGTQVGTPSASPFTDTGLTAGTMYNFRVAAVDAVPNVSSQSAQVSATTSQATDGQVPSAPTLTTTVISSTRIDLSWTASTDNVGVTGYRLYRGPILAVDQANRTYSNTGLTPDTGYSFTVRAYDAAGNVSAESNAITARTQASPDTQAPSVSALSAAAASSSSISLSWTASTDNVGVTGYRLYRAGTLTREQSGLSFTDTGLSAGTMYGYTVRAYDAAGNVSTESALAQATTNAASSGGGGGGGGGGSGGSSTRPVTASITASPEAIAPGGSVRLSWTTANATTVSLDNGIGKVSRKATMRVTPSQTTTYRLTATNSLGTLTKSVTVNVGQVASATCRLKDGSLIMSGGTTVYVIENCRRRPFTSGEVFTSLGMNWSNIVRDDATDIPVGDPVSNGDTRHTRGTLVLHDGTVYFMGTDMRYPFPSAEVFLSWGSRFQDIVPANAADLLVPVGPILRPAS